MNLGMTFLILRDGGVRAFIKPLIAVRYVAGGTAHAAHIAPFVPAAPAEVAALTFSANIGVYRLGGIFFYSF